MKKFVLFILIAFSAVSSRGQITLDTIVTTWNSIGYDFYPIQLSANETKYYFQDTLNNTFSLYNMDFTPFMLGIAVPEPFAPYTKNNQVIYITRTLFDCDSTNIEYAYCAIAGDPNKRTFYIMRIDGTQLFRLDSAVAPYCFGCLNGSQDIRPITNTSSGAKLFIYHPPNTNNLHIYSLCGALPVTVFDLKANNDPSMVRIFPNPSTGHLTFQITPPNNRIEYELLIFDTNLNEVHRQRINSWKDTYTLDFSQLSDGNYFYSLSSRDKIYHSGKFIIIK